MGTSWNTLTEHRGSQSSLLEILLQYTFLLSKFKYMIFVAKIQSYDIYVPRSYLYFPFDKSRTERNGKYLRGAGLFTYLLLTLYLCFINISYQYWYIAICMIHTVYKIWNKAESNQLHKSNTYCCTVYTAGVFIVSSVQFNLIFAMLQALLCHGTERAIGKFLEMKMQRNTTSSFSQSPSHFQPKPWWEASSFIQVPLCLSFSMSQAVFKC